MSERAETNPTGPMVHAAYDVRLMLEAALSAAAELGLTHVPPPLAIDNNLVFRCAQKILDFDPNSRTAFTAANEIAHYLAQHWTAAALAELREDLDDHQHTAEDIMNGASRTAGPLFRPTPPDMPDTAVDVPDEFQHGRFSRFGGNIVVDLFRDHSDVLAARNHRQGTGPTLAAAIADAAQHDGGDQ